MHPPIKRILFNKRMLPSCYWLMFIKRMHLIHVLHTRPRPHAHQQGVEQWFQSTMSKENLCQFSGSMAHNWTSIQQTNSVTVVFPCSRSTDTISPTVGLHTLVNMMTTNDALMENHSAILHVGSLNQKISQTSQLDEEIACASWTQIGGRGQKYALY